MKANILHSKVSIRHTDTASPNVMFHIHCLRTCRGAKLSGSMYNKVAVAVWVWGSRFKMQCRRLRRLLLLRPPKKMHSHYTHPSTLNPLLPLIWSRQAQPAPALHSRVVVPKHEDTLGLEQHCCIGIQEGSLPLAPLPSSSGQKGARRRADLFAAACRNRRQTKPNSLSLPSPSFFMAFHISLLLGASPNGIGTLLTSKAGISRIAN